MGGRRWGVWGGCSPLLMDDAAWRRSMQEGVADASRRCGGLCVPGLAALPSPEVDRYRNKVQFPVGRDKHGAPCIGFYAGRTHRIVTCPDCRLQSGVLNDIGNAVGSFFAANGLQPYDLPLYASYAADAPTSVGTLLWTCPH